MTLAAWLAASGCSTPTDTQPYDGLCTPLYALDWTPSAGSQDVPRDTIVRLQFSDYPDPDTANYGGLIVRTGVYYWSGTLRVDLIDKVVTYQPSGPWFAQLGY
ncbi:MAG TPA: Ig-like domain-containing protein, partial [Polyangia bacterium]|nr:Ig-like domain-containing protein [Polyangia bacterium]